MPISKRLRYEVLRRDDHRCRYCGAAAPDVQLTVDHVMPTALGGSDEPSNLATACRGCNAGKASTSPDHPIVEDVAHDALRWQKAMEQAASWQRDRRGERDEYVNKFETRWNGFGRTYVEDDEQRRPIALPRDWRSSLDRLFEAGLEEEVVREAIEIAMAKNFGDDNAIFKYFCGICWNKLKQRQVLAQEFLEAAA